MQPPRAAGSGIHHCQVQFVFACRETSRGGGSTAEKGRCLLKRKCLNAVSVIRYNILFSEMSGLILRIA